MRLPESLHSDIVKGDVYEDLDLLLGAIEDPEVVFIGSALIGEDMKKYDRDVRPYGLMVTAITLRRKDGKELEFPVYRAEGAKAGG